MKDSHKQIQTFIDTTQEVIYLRKIDAIMIVRPNKIHHLNLTAFDMLYRLYQEHVPVQRVVKEVSLKYRQPVNKIENDLLGLIASVKALMNDDYGKAQLLSAIPFDPGSIKFPVISEIALTYACQNRCDFCYASSPYRGMPDKEMTTAQVKRVIEKIYNEAHVPTLSFTGGEPTLREDLPELIAYADRSGLRTNLITNGLQCSDPQYVNLLAEAGLKSAQVSLESHNPDVHDKIVGNKGAFWKVVAAIHNLKKAGIFTHTNTTICRNNHDKLVSLADFIKAEFNNDFLSMNMIITTGIARDNDNVKINYSTIGKILKPLLHHCEVNEIRFVWYSPTPYCLFNPVEHDLGAKSCACVSGLLSVNPYGEVLPCSSYERGIGNLLHKTFQAIWNSDQAWYYRDKKFMPPVCSSCEYDVICGGACPLYWEHAGSFKEIEAVRNKRPFVRNVLWSIQHGLRVHTRGVKGCAEEGRS